MAKLVCTSNLNRMKRTFGAMMFAVLYTGLVPPEVNAATLNPDGLGEALLFPYYTVRSASGNAFNTYVSVVNHNSDSKALRVRFREGRNAREVATFNLFLAPNDVWVAALVPTAGGARLVSIDRSCVSPQLTGGAGETPGLEFTSAGYVGDGNGDELDRVREGWIEMVEMSTVTGATATAISQVTLTGTKPNDCSVVQGSAVVQTAPPTGGLAGTLTLINVASGLDFTVNADALADLAGAAYYRAANDPYPGFGASEIRPVSAVAANGFLYRSDWARGVDAVSAALMRSSWFGEVVLDGATTSRTDLVVVFPTRHHYVTGSTVAEPFVASCQFPVDTLAGEPVSFTILDREEFGGDTANLPLLTVTPNFRCGPATVVDFHNPSLPHTTFTQETSVLGSRNRGSPGPGDKGSFPNGWAGFRVTSGRTLTSLASSSRVNVATGQTTIGPHQFVGLPVIGFSVRTFVNGTLSCSAGACQGNYGGAFPLRFRRIIN